MRHFFLIFILLGLVGSASAEEFHYNYGIDGGISLANISTANSATTTSSRLAGIGGIYWEFFPKNWISLVPGGYALGKGYKPTSDKAVVLNYFQARFLGRISLYRSYSSRLFIDLGPSADFIFQKGTQNFTDPPQMSFFKDFDVSLLGGVGFETNVTKTARVVFNIKYFTGLIDLIRDTSTSVRSNGILFTTAIQFSTESNRIEPTEDRAREYIEKKHSLD